MYGMSAKDRAALFGGKSADKDTPKASSGPRKIGKLSTSFGKSETKTGAAEKKTVTKKTVTKKKKQVTGSGKAGEAKAEEVTTTTTTTVEQETGQPEKKTEETKVEKKEVIAEEKPVEKKVEEKKVEKKVEKRVEEKKVEKKLDEKKAEVKKVAKKVEEKKVEKRVDEKKAEVKKVEEKKVEKKAEKVEAVTKKAVVKKTEEKKPETKKIVEEKKADTDVATKHEEKDYVKKDEAGRDVKVHEEVKAETTTRKEGGKQVTATKTTKVTKTVSQEEKPVEVVGTKTVTKKTTKMETKTKDVKPGAKAKEETLTVKTSKPAPGGDDSDWDLSAELQANIDVVSDVELGPEGTIQMKKKVVKKEEPTKVLTKTTETKTVGEGGAVKTVVTTETKTTKPEVKTTVVKKKVVKKLETKVEPKEAVTVTKKTVVEKVKIDTEDVPEGGVFIVSAETDFEESETVPAATLETKVEVADEEHPVFIIETSTDFEESVAADVEEEPVFIIETSTEVDEEVYKQEPVFEVKTEVVEEEAPVFIMEASTTFDETVTPEVTIKAEVTTDEKPAIEVKAAVEKLPEVVVETKPVQKVVEPEKVPPKPEPEKAKPVEPKKVEKKPEPKPAAVTVKAEEPREVKPKVVEKKPEEKPVEPKKVEKKPEPKPAAVTVKAEEPKEVKPKIVEKKPEEKPVEPKKVEDKPEPKPAVVTVKAEEPKEVKPKVIVEKKPEAKPVEPEKKPEPKPVEKKPEVKAEPKKAAPKPASEAAVVTSKIEEVKEVKMQVKAEKEADQEVCEIMQTATEEPTPEEENAKEETTEVIMNKTFTESIRPGREFIPIPEEFYNTIFYFSGMGSAIGSAVSRGVYVPFHTAKVGLEAETIEAEEAKKKTLNETTRRVTVVRQAREEATDLTTDLRKLQLLLSGIPTFQDTEGVPKLPSRPVDEPLHYKYLQNQPHIDQYTTRTQTTRRYEMSQAPSAAPFILAKPPTKPVAVVVQPSSFTPSKIVMERVREEIERNRLEQLEREKQNALEIEKNRLEQEERAKQKALEIERNRLEQEEREKQKALQKEKEEAILTATVEAQEPPKAPEPAWKAGAVQTCLVMPRAEPVEPVEVRTSPIAADKYDEVETEAQTDKIKPPPPPPPPLKKPEAGEVSPEIDKKEGESKPGIDTSYSAVAAAIAWEAEAEKLGPYRPPSPIAAPTSQTGQIPEPPSLDSFQGQTRVPVFKPVAFQSQHPKMQFGVGSAIHADTKPQFDTRPVVSHPPKTYDYSGKIRSVAPPTSFSARPVAPPAPYGNTGTIQPVTPAPIYGVHSVSPATAYGGSGTEVFREYKAERPATGDEHDGVSMQGSVKSKGLKTWQLSRLRALEARGYEIKPDLEHETYDQLESKADSMPDDVVARSYQHSAKGYQRFPTKPVKIEPQAHEPVRSCSFQPKGIGTTQQQEIALPYSDM